MNAEFFVLAVTAALNPKLLALGLLLLVGVLVVTGRLHARRKATVPAADGQPGAPEKEKDGWARLLAEPRLGLAILVGAVCGIPGAAYLSGLHILVTSKASTANQVIGSPCSSSSSSC